MCEGRSHFSLAKMTQCRKKGTKKNDEKRADYAIRFSKLHFRKKKNKKLFGCTL